LENARKELSFAFEFDHWIINKDLEQAYDLLRAVYLAQTTQPRVQPGLPKTVLSTWKGGA
jgi:guanylate kinase